MNNISGISVILCTYNGAARLPSTLSYLAGQQTFPGMKWEVVLVDNNSTDHSGEYAKEIWHSYKNTTPLKVVKEKLQGLSNARIRGIQAAQFDLLLFCDDDNWLEKTYLQTAYMHFLNNPCTGILGGWGKPVFEREKPFWFDRFENVYAIGRQGKVSGIVNEKKYLYGAGMVARKAIFQRLNDYKYQFLLSDRKKEELTSGNDSEICLLALQLGYNLYYEEQLQFQHFIPGNRLQWDYAERMLTKGFAYHQVYLAMYDYCFQQAKENKKAIFENLYRFNIRKQKRILWKEWKFGEALLSFLSPKPGNEKLIRIKTALNKLLFLKKHKQQLADDFKKIEGISAFCVENTFHRDKGF